MVANDTPNFAPKGNIVAGVPRGTGVMVMANDMVTVRGNTLVNNPTAQVLVVSYPREFTDKTYNPVPRHVLIDSNVVRGGGNEPQIPNAEQLLAAFGGALPAVVWDGQGIQPTVIGQDSHILALGQSSSKIGMAQVKPGLVDARAKGRVVAATPTGAPAALDARARP